MTKTALMAAAVISLFLIALTPLTEAAPSSGSDYDTIIRDARKLEESGKVKEALDKYTLAMKSAPDKAEPLARASMLHLILKNPREALAAASRAVEIEPAHEGAWLNKSVIEIYSGLYKEALATTNKALQRFPENTDIMNNKATALLALHKLNDAEDTLLEALKIKPDDSSLNYNLACAYALSEVRMSAILYLEKAIALDPALKIKARTDPDLTSIRDSKFFKDLTAD